MKKMFLYSAISFLAISGQMNLANNMPNTVKNSHYLDQFIEEVLIPSAKEVFENSKLEVESLEKWALRNLGNSDSISPALLDLFLSCKYALSYPFHLLQIIQEDYPACDENPELEGLDENNEKYYTLACRLNHRKIEKHYIACYNSFKAKYVLADEDLHAIEQKAFNTVKNNNIAEEKFLRHTSTKTSYANLVEQLASILKRIAPRLYNDKYNNIIKQIKNCIQHIKDTHIKHSIKDNLDKYKYHFRKPGTFLERVLLQDMEPDCYIDTIEYKKIYSNSVTVFKVVHAYLTEKEFKQIEQDAFTYIRNELDQKDEQDNSVKIMIEYLEKLLTQSSLTLTDLRFSFNALELI